MSDTDLKQQAEGYLGTSIQDCEWDKNREQAERKLGWIISREGDADGTRREPWYLAQLIAEAVRVSRFSQFTFELCATMNELAQIDLNDWGKKEQPVS